MATNKIQPAKTDIVQCWKQVIFIKIAPITMVTMFYFTPLVALVAWSYMAGDNKPAVATTTQRACWSGWRSYLELISLPRWNDDFRPICRSANYIVNICISYIFIYMYNMYIICYNIIYLYKICIINIHVCMLWTFVYHIYIYNYIMMVIDECKYGCAIPLAYHVRYVIRQNTL
jgi:hypothetical protein